MFLSFVFEGIFNWCIKTDAKKPLSLGSVWAKPRIGILNHFQRRQFNLCEGTLQGYHGIVALKQLE
jgi:hypothetical protein